MDKQRYNQTSDRVYIVSELTNHIIDKYPQMANYKRNSELVYTCNNES